jgi:hypothetical protein
MSDITFPKITARFYVAEVTKRPNQSATVVLQPAYANGANKDWSQATPSGKIELYVSNPDAVASFEAALGLPMEECLEVTFAKVKSQPRE